MSLYQALILFHVVNVCAVLPSGALAMIARKGSGWHGAAGTVFFVSMLGMASSGAFISAFLKPIVINVVVGLLSIYLVSTAWRAAKRRNGATDAFDIGAFVWIVAVGIIAVGSGIEAAMSPTGMKQDVPAVLYFVFGSVALLCAVTDIRMFVRGGVFGGRRIARHLWRMGLALLIATISFFPGQARLFPKWLRDTNFLYVPHVLLIGSMLFWMYRVSAKRRMVEART
ncbi:MAG TPA: hypothetical protein VN181_09110 [Thermoanaerobaculia bacterium]|nr:hypothetical protein [Thermoanaerobaculia bacterium]